MRCRRDIDETVPTLPIVGTVTVFLSAEQLKIERLSKGCGMFVCNLRYSGWKIRVPSSTFSQLSAAKRQTADLGLVPTLSIREEPAKSASAST